ncbi:hypothetical protein LX36DRAFT_664840 [Colletotrichum falcatum]|nr:hypothetical protein LX36DRAFT_664840 [Colletotrichum falcatum]
MCRVGFIGEKPATTTITATACEGHQPLRRSHADTAHRVPKPRGPLTPTEVLLVYLLRTVVVGTSAPCSSLTPPSLQSHGIGMLN